MRGLLLTLGGLLMVGGGWTSAARGVLADQGRNLVRPLLLPMLWKGLANAQRDGTPEEYAARGRVLMKLLPRWTDGYIHIAGRLAFDASLAQGSTTGALDRLMAALAYLDEARAEMGPGPRGAAARETILRNQARFLYTRCAQDPRLAAGFLQRTGQSPAAWAMGYLRKVPRLAGSTFLKADLCFSLIEGLVIDIRLKEPRDRLLQSLDTAVGLLDQVRDRELAAAWRISLQKVQAYLVSGDEEALGAMRNDPRLRDFLGAFAAPPTGRESPPK